MLVQTTLLMSKELLQSETNHCEDLFARQKSLVAKVGEIKKYDPKTKQLSFRGKMPSICPFLFFFAHDHTDAQSDDAKKARYPLTKM